MKVRSAIKKICPHCYIVRRGKTRFVYCRETPKHKQRQGFHTSVIVSRNREPFDMNICHVIAPPSTASKVTLPTHLNISSTPPSFNFALSPATKYVPSAGLFSMIPL